MHRAIAAGATAVLVLEALTVAFVNWVLGLAVQHQSMSLAGLDPDAMAIGSWAAGAGFAFFLLCCAVLTARIAARDTMVGRLGRIVLIVCAVVQGVLGAVVAGVVGWGAFAAIMLVLGLLVATLLLYAPEDREPAPAVTGTSELPPPAAA